MSFKENPLAGKREIDLDEVSRCVPASTDTTQLQSFVFHYFTKAGRKLFVGKGRDIRQNAFASDLLRPPCADCGGSFVVLIKNCKPRMELKR